jgi:signal transduction histidine kinase
MSRGSIRRRLLASIAIVQLCVAVLGTTLVVRQARRESFATFDAKLGEHVAAVTSAIDIPEEGGGAVTVRQELLSLPKEDRFRLSDSSGRTMGESPGWHPTTAMPLGKRNVMNFDERGIRYRGLLVRDLAMPDSENGEHALMPQLTIFYASPTAPTEAHVHRVALSAGFAGGVIFLLSMMATAGAVAFGLRPLNDLAARAAAVDAGNWNFNAQEGESAVRELVPLVTALTKLVERLRTAFERERQFFSDAAHELKTCVAILMSTLQFAVQSPRSAEEYRVALIRALEDGNRLQGLVARMLLLAWIERSSDDAKQGYSELLHVESELELVVDAGIALAQARHLKLRVTDFGSHWIRMPSDDFRVAITNVIENAIQYSSPGGSVEIRVSEHANDCVIRITDTGCGIPPESLPHIFERFYRSDESRSRTSGGFGLGLAIAQTAVTGVRGALSVESTVGVGSAFTIRLPLASKHLSTPASKAKSHSNPQS